MVKKLPSVLCAAALALVAPLFTAPLAKAHVASAATISDLGDLSSFSVIVADTLKITQSGDLAAAEKRITNFETAWDEAAGDLQPKDPAKWRAVDVAADQAIEGLRASSPNAGEIEVALNGLLAKLDNRGGRKALAVIPAAMAGALTITDQDGSPLPCEVALKTLREASASRHPSDQAQFDELQAKGIERCNADDDKRADRFFADAYALLQ